MRTARRPLLLALLATARCSQPPPATDTTLLDASDVAPADTTSEPAPDAPPVDAGTLSVSDDTARVELTSQPLRLRMLHPDGTPWLASPADRPLLDVGATLPGLAALTFLDPRTQTPGSVQWRAPQLTGRTADGQGFLFVDARVGPVELRLERVREGTYRVRIAASGADASMLRFHFAADDAPYYGLGERFGPLDARGQVIPMQLQASTSESGTNETHVPVPFFVTPRAYGVFVQTREAGAFDVGAADPTQVIATFQGSAADVVLFAAPSPAQTVARYAQHAGLPRRLSRWVYGHQQWRNEWASSDELLGDAARLRSEHIPTSTMWIDNPWEASYNDHVVDTRRFADPPALLQALAHQGFRTLVWSTPYLDTAPDGATPVNRAQQLSRMAAAGSYFVNLMGAPWLTPASFTDPADGHRVQGAMMDFSAPGASDFWTTQLQSIVQLGVRGFKLDYGEDVLPNLGSNRPGWQFAGGHTDREERSLYPQRYHQAYRDALDRYAGGDGFLLVRASSWGGQSVCDVLWPGDLDNDFSAHDEHNTGGLPSALHGMVSAATSGFAYFASDTGGYRGGAPTSEALVRWAEQSSLALVMQLGGGGPSHNPWMYDASTTALYAGLARLHNDLVPYLRALGDRAATDGTPPVLPLAMAFPDDAALAAEGDAYMLGDDLLVAPVVTQGATSRALRLPAGRWIHWFTGEAFTGPASFTIAAPLGQPVLLARAGTAIPLLASDVDTLVTTDASDVVDEGDRASVLRVRAWPAASARVLTMPEGTTVGVQSLAASVALQFHQGSATRDLRAELDWGHREATVAGTPSSATRDGAALTLAPSASAVQQGCDGCWFYDAARATVWLGLRGNGNVVVQ